MYYVDVNEYKEIIQNITSMIYRDNKGIEYVNLSCSFDIETSSFLNDEEEKTAIMYMFAIDIKHNIFIGRTWADFESVLNMLREVFQLGSGYKRYLYIYVHNLSYEFQFLSKRYDFEKVFALDERKVIYARTDGIIFKCSYLLSGYSLANLAKIKKLPIKKLTGELNYKHIRHSNTIIQSNELDYLINDVEIVVYYIEQLLQKEQKIFNIPLTKTSYVRRYTRKNCDTKEYKQIMKSLKLTPEEYKYLKLAFQGGFTHANMFNTDKVFDNVASYDFTSSYPAVMCSEQFPMSRGEIIDNPSEEEINKSLKNYCCILDITFKNIECKYIADEPISFSKSNIKGKYDLHNGRVVKADELNTVCTEQDYFTYNDFYNYDEVKINKIIRYFKFYLPKEFISSMLDLYEQKTKLKGVEGADFEYLNSKEMLNSMYGMSVTDICRDEIIFKEHEWSTEKVNVNIAIQNYNKSRSRFLYYPWGVWVTAYARRNLFSAIKEIKSDYIYADTDSVKILNHEKYKYYFENYNKTIKEKITKCLNNYNIPIEKASPKTIKGVSKWLGVWDFEGVYQHFKTLGAKRYMIMKYDCINITVAGLNKGLVVPYILEHLGIEYDEHNKISLTNYTKVFDFFADGMYIPKGHTGKNVHTYIDEERKGFVVDYRGVKGYYDELSSVHLDESDYELTTARAIVDLLLRFRIQDG